jgi:hypothetical protein
VLGDLLVVGKRPELGEAQLHGALDQAVDPEAVVGEAGVEQPPVPVGLGEGAVEPEIRGDVLFRVLAGLGVDVLE